MEIIFEDYYLLAVDKPAGLSTENGLDQHPSAEAEALAYFRKQLAEKSKKSYSKELPYLRAAHRLDRPASGVVLFAKTKTALTDLMNQFERGEVEKIYLAVVEKAPPETTGRLAHWISRDASGKKAVISDKQTRGAQTCVLNYTVRETRASGVLLEIRPLTGRFHQIRAQLAFIGCPIVGDTLYGASPWKPDQIKLHARSLSVKHPKTGLPLMLEARWSEDSSTKSGY